MELFDQQSSGYKYSVLPLTCRARVSIEAGSTDCWARYVGMDGVSIGMDRFGDSAPAKALFQLFGFTVDNIVAKAQNVIASCRSIRVMPATALDHLKSMTAAKAASRGK